MKGYEYTIQATTNNGLGSANANMRSDSFKTTHFNPLTKEKDMGLDQAMFSSSGEKEYDWRKHARLQVFMARKWREKNPSKEPEGAFGLGFNSGDEPLVLKKADLDEWQEEIKNKYWNSFATDGFFWGQQFQEESVKEYKKQDQEAVDWARTQLEQGHKITYECSW